MSKTNSKFTSFIKRNIAYLSIAFCIIAVGLSVTLAITTGAKKTVNTVKKEPEPQIVIDEPVEYTDTYILPVNNSTSLSYYSEAMVFNSTLKRFSAHKAVDFFADEGTSVFAIADGKVTAVETTLIYGTTITVEHANGLTSIYNSVSDGDYVWVGKTVKQGDKIGEISVTNRQEYAEGPHLHFSMQLDGETVDPANYLVFSEK